MAQIHMIMEPEYVDSHWARAYVQGIREEAGKRGLAITAVTPEQAAKGQPLLILGSRNDWLEACLRFIEARGALCVVAGAVPENAHCAFAAPDYADAIARFAAYARGKQALFAIHPDSAADRVKRTAFKGLCEHGVVFENRGSLLNAAKALAESADTFDSVLCANDVAAMVLKRALPASGGIPRLYAFGDQELPEEERVAVFRMDLAEAGRQAVRLYRTAQKDGAQGYRRCCWVRCALWPPLPALEREEAATCDPAPAATGDFYCDPQVPQAFQFKALLLRCDALDLDILRELLMGGRYPAIMERLHTTEGTIKYRVKRMMGHAGLDTRDALLELARHYLSPAPSGGAS